MFISIYSICQNVSYGIRKAIVWNPDIKIHMPSIGFNLKYNNWVYERITSLPWSFPERTPSCLRVRPGTSIHEINSTARNAWDSIYLYDSS